MQQERAIGYPGVAVKLDYERSFNMYHFFPHILWGCVPNFDGKLIQCVESNVKHYRKRDANLHRK